MRSGVELQHAVNGWLQGLLGPSSSAGRARSVTVPSRYEEDQEDDLATAAQSVTRATMGALQKQIRAAGFKGAEVSGWGKGTDGGFTVRYQGQDYRFSISEAQMRNNGRGLYHGTGVAKNDMVLHQDHRGRWRIDLVTSNSGHHQTIGTTKGYGGLSEAAREAGSEAHKRGINSGLLYRQEPDGSYGLHYEQGPDGKTARLRDLRLMANGRRGKKLPSQRNEPSMRRDVLTDFMNCPSIDGEHTPEAVFEHDAWWVQCKCGAQWSVVDVETRGGDHYFDFEQVSQGDEGYHGDYEPNGRMYHVIVINERTGRREYMTSEPVTHAEGVVILGKLRPHKDTRAMLEEAMVANPRKKRLTVGDLPSKNRVLGPGERSKVLACPGCGEEFSADPSDYFLMRPGEPLKCMHCGEYLRLADRRPERQPPPQEARHTPGNRAWDAAEAKGLVRMVVEPEQENYFDVYGEPDTQEERDLIIANIEAEGLNMFASQYRKSRADDWETADSIGMIIGDLADTGYEDDLKQAALDALKGHRPNAARSVADPTAQRELILYLENDYALIGAPNSIGKSIDTNLRKKLAKGSYEPKLAPKAWLHLCDAAARKYTKEFASGEPVIFNLATRWEAAKELAAAWEVENLPR